MGDSTISSGTSIRGLVKADGDLEVHGYIEGTIESGGTVTIGSGAAIKSDVTGRHVHVSGAVSGNLHGSELVVLEDGARVVGDLSAPSIGIRPGALLRGRVETGAGGKPKPRAVGATADANKTTANRPAKKVVKKAAKKAAKKRVAKKAPAPVMPKAPPRGKKTAAKATKKATKKRVAKKAPAPKVPALRRSKKATRRRSR